MVILWQTRAAKQQNAPRIMPPAWEALYRSSDSRTRQGSTRQRCRSVQVSMLRDFPRFWRKASASSFGLASPMAANVYWVFPFVSDVEAVRETALCRAPQRHRFKSGGCRGQRALLGTGVCRYCGGARGGAVDVVFGARPSAGNGFAAAATTAVRAAVASAAARRPGGCGCAGGRGG